MQVNGPKDERESGVKGDFGYKRIRQPRQECDSRENKWPEVAEFIRSSPTDDNDNNSRILIARWEENWVLTLPLILIVILRFANDEVDKYQPITIIREERRWEGEGWTFIFETE